uniref:Transmembrane protein n=1 Tax=Oryza rufipogon TaxID=4529 RepID=A0A0E0QDU0_ORYRU
MKKRPICKQQKTMKKEKNVLTWTFLSILHILISNFSYFLLSSPLTAITVLLNDLPVVPLLNHRLLFLFSLLSFAIILTSYSILHVCSCNNHFYFKGKGYNWREKKRIKLERKGKRTVEDNQQNIRLGKELDKMEKTKRSMESNS